MKPIERVLVKDDDAIAIFLIKHLLSSIGIDEHIHFAYNGAESLAHVKEAAAQGRLQQLILLDIKMPVMGGFAFLKELDKPNLTDTKIVLLTVTKAPGTGKMQRKVTQLLFSTSRSQKKHSGASWNSRCTGEISLSKVHFPAPAGCSANKRMVRRGL